MVNNVNTEALEKTRLKAKEEPDAARQKVAFTGEWQLDEGAPQFRGTIAFSRGEVEFVADFPPPMGGTGAAPNPLAYCFWGGLACYAMTFAQEASSQGIELNRLRARLETVVDQTRALGLSDNPPVGGIDWYLEVEANASPEKLAELKRQADDHCPGVYCVRNPVDLTTHIDT